MLTISLESSFFVSVKYTDKRDRALARVLGNPKVLRSPR